MNEKKLLELARELFAEAEESDSEAREQLREDIRSGIYAICHKESGLVYVGQSKNIARRWYRHQYELRNGSHTSTRLQRSWLKHGAAAFKFTMLEAVEADRDALCVAEQRWIDHYKPTGLFNLAPVAGSLLGYKNSPEAVAVKLAAQRRPEVNAKRSASLKAAWGTPEMRALQSVRTLTAWADPEARARRAANIKASKSTPEARAEASRKQSAYQQRRREAKA